MKSRKVIPLVPATAPKDMDTEIRGCAELEPYALRVVGDSMAPEFHEGHIIVLDPGLPATHGAYVVIEVGGETIFRQFWTDSGRALLRPLNDEYPVIELTADYRVRGVVTQRAGRRRSDRKRYD
jgi:DNA polymerase V